MAVNQTLIPQLGFGTYGRTGKKGVEAILCALQIGYRHIDTAQTCDTESEVGQAVKLSGLPRGEVFVTTKISTENFGIGQVVPSLERSLEQLKLDQVDIALIHWPSPNGKQPLAQYLEQLLLAQDQGLTRLIGVSNFTIAQLEQAITIAGPGRIVNNQFELNPWLQNKKLASYCNSKDITVTCYLPIAKGAFRRDPVISAIAALRGATAEQVVLAWEFAKGYCAIPTSSNPDHIRSNHAATKLTLDADEIERIDAIDRGQRAIDPAWGPDWDQK